MNAHMGLISTIRRHVLACNFDIKHHEAICENFTHEMWHHSAFKKYLPLKNNLLYGITAWLNLYLLLIILAVNKPVGTYKPCVVRGWKWCDHPVALATSVDLSLSILTTAVVYHQWWCYRLHLTITNKIQGRIQEHFRGGASNITVNVNIYI